MAWRLEISKNKLKELTAYRLQKRCDEEAVFVVEGPKMASEALSSGFKIRTICATSEWLDAHPAPLAGELYTVGLDELQRLSSMKAPNQVWMLLERPATQPLLPGSKITLALDRLQDPGNVGTIMRTADWFGVRHIVCSSDTVDFYNPKVVQSSMGAVFRTRVEYTDLPQWLSQSEVPVYGASLQGIPLAHTPSPKGNSILIIGNESRGISPEVMNHVTHPVLIPNQGGTAESLNAASAAAILMFHFCNN